MPRANRNNNDSDRLNHAKPARRSKTIAVIGAGRLGVALARALTACGYAVVAVAARHATHAKRAAKLISPRTQALTANRLRELPPVDVLLITTPDDLIAETALLLVDLMPSPSPKRRVALHASGAITSEVLAPLRARGLSVGSMHPLISVSDPVAGTQDLRKAFYCLEGDPQAVRTARKMVRDLGGQTFFINKDDKTLYHAAAVITCGHMVALFDLGIQLLVSCGLPNKQARSVLLPLLRSTMGNLASQDTARALTGPFARADVATVRKHLGALQSQAKRAAVAIYILLGQHSLKLAEEKGADVEGLKEIADTLRKAADSLQ